MKPDVLRKMVTESRTGLSPPLISRDKGNVSEMDILYNRIDQQVELISVLKQRLDEMTKRWERSEAELEQQEIERSKVQQSHIQIAKKYSNLEVRWHQLSGNHNEMIALKDDYKDKCRLLTERLKKLEAGESAALAVEQRKYHDLKKQVSDLKESQRKHVSHETSLQETIKSLESQVELMLEKENKLLEDFQHTQIYHKQSVSQFELKLEDNDASLAQSKNQNEQMKSQISDLTQQIIIRGKLVQDKDDNVKKLQSDKKRVDEKNKKLAKELVDLTESVNSNRIVKDLREKLIDEKDRFKRLEMELELFKTAAKEQLMKEQSVNKQLRHVSLDRA
ncbi:coiled-coil domain-containing protein 89-like [Bolinopsis microptera]|uniref:coiled-coil domain-containing protein 89-like n=1 Tax=Bolinopsis microptera TaxID=2820187 RepID=UPI00307A774F